jgi:predicted nuclease of restriction endonuclease-like (RecB) superfamily
MARSPRSVDPRYPDLVRDLSTLLESARGSAARAVNAVMTATYWEIGRRIVEHEQGGRSRAEYGKELIHRLAADLTRSFGRGFSPDNLERMRRFYRTFPATRISATLSRKSLSGSPPSSLRPPRRIRQTASADSGTKEDGITAPADSFPLPWSHYVLLLSRVRSQEALVFYHAEALRGGWTVRQLARQIGSQFYERAALSRNKTKLLAASTRPRTADAVTASAEIRDPLVLEFLDLKDEYSESDLEEALIGHLESFLLELGGDFAFIGRQRRLRIGNAWYRVDLVFFHRGLRCLVIVDLKLDAFTPADAGQMHLYCNYARAHWTRSHENPPVGVILCAGKDEAVASYALEGLPSPTLVREYRAALPKERVLAAELARTRARLEERAALGAGER